MAAILTYAVGDIHGSHGKLVRLMDRCLQHCGADTFRFIFIGDYVDRGPQSREVVDLLMETQAEAPDQIVCLKGNHEDMLTCAAKGIDADLWIANGGDATLDSYGVDHACEIPPAHLDWFETLTQALSDGKRLFVHAGVMPGVPLDRQSAYDALWIREPFLSDPRDHGLFIVHGHTPTPTRAPDLRRNRLNIDTGACFGRPLTAAVFDETTVGPLAFISDEGAVVEAPPLAALAQV